MNGMFIKVDITSKTLHRIFTESKNLIHNFWRDAHSNLVDFHGKVL